MSRADLHDHCIIGPCELHVSFAFIGAIGNFVEGTGMPELLPATFSDSTVNSIIHGKNFRRSIEVHVRTLAALQMYYAFFEHAFGHQHVHCQIQKLCMNLDEHSEIDIFSDAKMALNDCDLQDLFIISVN